MIITCPSCEKKFEVNASLIPNEGKLLQCGACSHKWFFKKEKKREIKHEVKKTLIKTTEIIDKKVPDNTEKLISEAETAVTKKANKSNKENKINFLSFLIVVVITLVAIVVVADTFKNIINNYFPGFDLVLNNLYETLKDVMLFFKDLFN